MSPFVVGDYARHFVDVLRWINRHWAVLYGQKSGNVEISPIDILLYLYDFRCLGVDSPVQGMFTGATPSQHAFSVPTPPSFAVAAPF